MLLDNSNDKRASPPPDPRYAGSASTYPNYPPPQSYPDQSYGDQRYADQSYPDQSYSGQSSADQRYADQTYRDERYQQQTYPQQTYPDQRYSDQSYPDQRYPQQIYPDQRYPQQPYPQQTYQQTYPNQNYPSAPMMLSTVPVPQKYLAKADKWRRKLENRAQKLESKFVQRVDPVGGGGWGRQSAPPPPRMMMGGSMMGGDPRYASVPMGRGMEDPGPPLRGRRRDRKRGIERLVDLVQTFRTPERPQATPGPSNAVSDREEYPPAYTPPAYNNTPRYPEKQ